MHTVAQGNNRFATDLYAQLKDGGSENLFFSPFSLSTALAMTSAGAAGETQKEMAQTLHFALPDPELHPAMADFQKRLVASSKSESRLRIANRLWGQTDYRFHNEFLEVARDRYGAGLALMDFAQDPEAARRQINSWVEKQTGEKIRDLLAPGILDQRTKLVLTNAIYFKGTWQNRFPEDATEDGPFHLPAGGKLDVPMMHQQGQFGYRAGENLQVLEMPYAGGTLSMLVLLPREVDGLTRLEKDLSAENVQEWTSGLHRQKTLVYLPRFKAVSQFALKETLQAMGMKLAFDQVRADFSRMSPGEGLYISAVVHKAFVDVNEEGTEAAAASGVVMAPRSAMVRPQQPPVFRADHPFLFLIRDSQSGAILFMGRVTNPSQ
ncbi:MAG: serpin family protein [Thermoguttaceae bacterium]